MLFRSKWEKEYPRCMSNDTGERIPSHEKKAPEKRKEKDPRAQEDENKHQEELNKLREKLAQEEQMEKGRKLVAERESRKKS